MGSVGQEIRNRKRREYFGITVNVDPTGRRIWPPELYQRIAEASYKSDKSRKLCGRMGYQSIVSLQMADGAQASACASIYATKKTVCAFVTGRW
jgi:hypothetical protein